MSKHKRSAMKLKWLLDNVPSVHEAAKHGSALFGTVDSWLIWNLTGGASAGIHLTDVTNASRTMLLNLATLQWDKAVCERLGIPMSMLPGIRSSSEVYGACAHGPFKGVPISGCLGDQQAALLGQGCLTPGTAKNTYGTGCFLLCNTGEQLVHSKAGLLSTVAFKLGPEKPAIYALEGSIAIAGAAIQWLRDNLGIIRNANEVNELAEQVSSSAGLYFVPAFSGLFAPHWRSDARGVIVGITQYTTKSHLARAALEAVCYQTVDVVHAMQSDFKAELSRMHVDGGMTKSNLMLQTQADLLGTSVLRPRNAESTALGAAVAAGLAVNVWSSPEQILANLPVDAEFQPRISDEARNTMMAGWRRAIEKSLNLE